MPEYSRIVAELMVLERVWRWCDRTVVKAATTGSLINLFTRSAYVSMES